MTHILGLNERRHGLTFTADKPQAAAVVKTIARDTVEVQATIEIEGEVKPGLMVLRGDTELTRLPDHIRVVDPDGKEIKPSRGKVFAITVETFDPYHGVTEVKK